MNVRPLTGNSTDVIDKIEDVFEQMTDAMLNEKSEISITLKTRRRVATDEPREDRTKRLTFPGKTANEAWRFGEIVPKFSSKEAPMLTHLQRS